MKYGIDAAVTPGTWTIPADVRAALREIDLAHYTWLLDDLKAWFGNENISAWDLEQALRSLLNVW